MANDMEKRITAKMVLDSSGYNDKLKGLNAEMKKHQSELKLASEGIKQYGADSEKLKSVHESLTKQVELHSKKVDLYKQSIEKANAKMQDNIKERDKLKASLEAANKKYDEAVKIYGKESEQAKKAKEEVDKLKTEHEKAGRSVESNAKQIQNYETNLNKAKEQMVKAQGELEKVGSELDKSNNKWVKASEGLKSSSEKLTSLGSKVSGVGDSILKFTAPLAAGGIASLKFATDFEDSIAKVSTISEESEVSITDLRKGILNLSNDTGIASTEIANNVYDAISAGQKTGDALNFVTNSTKLAKAGFADAGASLDVLTTILNAYKMKSEEVTNVSDILIQVQNKGKVTVGELASVMGKVIPTAVATNTNLKQLGAGYALMTANGIKAAETTTYMNSMLNELSKTGTDADKALKEISGKSFSELMKEGKNLSDVLNMLDGYANKNKLSLKDMFGSAEAGKAALVLSTNAGKDFNTMLKDMETSAGSTDVAFKKVTNTTGERFKKSLNKLKNDAIKLGDSIAPIMDKLSGLLAVLAEKLNGLSKEQLDNMAKWGMFSIAAGGAFKIVGGGISTIGNIAGGISKLTGSIGKFTTATKGIEGAAKVAGTATNLASKGFSAVGLAAKLGTLAFNPWVLGAAAVGVAGVVAAKKLKEEAVPEVDLFKDKVETSSQAIVMANGQVTEAYEQTTIKISEGTKKAVGEYMKLDEGATKSLTNLYVNGTKITNDTAKNLTDTYDKMGVQIKGGMDKHYNDQVKCMQEFFSKSKNISDEDKTRMLQDLQKSNENKKAEIDNYNKRIQEILTNASKNNRELTKEEQQEINKIQEKMKTNAVKSLSDSEVESKVILERLKGYSERMTAEQASEVIKNAEKQRKESVEKAEKQYDETVRNIIKMRDESKNVTKEQADKLIEEAERQKKESIDKANEMKSTVVGKIKEMNSETLKNIDENDGHIKTKWEKLKGWFSNNPITRWIKSKTEGDPDVGHSWTGNNYWRGGLTYLHDAPGENTNYELYDLPRGTRIYNHDASQELVIRTAESVAERVEDGMLKKFNSNVNGGMNVTQNIYSPTSSPSELARQTKNSLRELALEF